MKVVVTGASGNVGTAVLDRLATEPAVTSVTGIARRVPDTPPPGKATWASADVAVDDLRPLLAGADVVVHLAWLFQPTHRPQVTWTTNVLGSLRLLEAVEAEHVGALVVASSVGAYSPRTADTPVDESWPTHGWSPAPYSREKAYVERLLDIFEHRNPDCRVVRMRPAFIFQASAATEQRRLFAGPLLPGSLARPEWLPMLPFPSGLRVQALHAYDAAAAYALALREDVSGAFNLAAEPLLDQAVLTELLRTRLPAVPPVAFKAALRVAWGAHVVPASGELFDMAMRLPVLDSSRAREELGWTPTRSAADAVSDFLRGLQHGAAGETPPLSEEAGGRWRWREFLTGLGSKP